MRITKYRTLLDVNRFPKLFKEKAVNYGDCNFTNPKSIVEMMNDVFLLDVQTEEYVYELCFLSNMKLIGVFEISHGTINCSLSSQREIFQKALLCGASQIVLVHNHPSGDEKPSREDRAVKVILDNAGKMIGIPVIDNIIVGKGGRYFSLCSSS